MRANYAIVGAAQSYSHFFFFKGGKQSLSFLLSLLFSSLSTSFPMARRYDSRTTIFSPEGRLYQVEYAMEAISNAGAALGVLASDGVVLAAEKRITSKVRRKRGRRVLSLPFFRCPRYLTDIES